MFSGGSMRRREFITLVCGAAATWPLAARAHPASKVWRIGILDTASREQNVGNITAFLKGMRDLGYVEGQNLVIDYRTADGHTDQLPGLVSELVTLRVDVIVLRGTPEVLAVKHANAAIPVVMSGVVDPVALGVAVSLSHPGGSITGMSSSVTVLEAKRIQLLKELAPNLKRLAVLGDFSNPAVAMQWEEVRAAAPSLAIEAQRFALRGAEDVTRVFQELVSQKFDAIRVGVDGVTRPNRGLIISLAAMHKLPAIYAASEFAADGGLIAYGANYPALYARAAGIVDKLFKGAHPADIPVEQPTKFDLVVNLRTAKALGLDVPPTLLASADEVIE
jgi:putative tryptophan/tyrosine transport system substrate-binding protein